LLKAIGGRNIEALHLNKLKKKQSKRELGVGRARDFREDKRDKERGNKEEFKSSKK